MGFARFVASVAVVLAVMLLSPGLGKAEDRATEPGTPKFTLAKIVRAVRDGKKDDFLACIDLSDTTSGKARRAYTLIFDDSALGEDVARAIKAKFGSSAARDMESCFDDKIPLMVVARNAGFARISEVGDRATVTMPDGETSIAMVRRNGSWLIEVDARTRMLNSEDLDRWDRLHSARRRIRRAVDEVRTFIEWQMKVPQIMASLAEENVAAARATGEGSVPRKGKSTLRDIVDKWQGPGIELNIRSDGGCTCSITLNASGDGVSSFITIIPSPGGDSFSGTVGGPALGGRYYALTLEPTADPSLLRGTLGEKSFTLRRQGGPPRVARPQSDPASSDDKGDTGAMDPDGRAETAGWLSMAKNYIRAGMPDKAKPYLKRVLEKYPGTDPATKAKALLEEMDAGGR